MSIRSIDPNAWPIIGALLAIDLAQGLTLEEQNVFGNFMIDIGQNLLTIAAAEEARVKAAEEQKNKEEETKKEEKKKEETEEKQPAESKEKKEADKGAEQQKGEPATESTGKELDTEDEDVMIIRKLSLQRRIECLEEQIRRLTAAWEEKNKA